ncbi:MAG TPA: hypothetical protein VHN74_20615 [Candidatus Angelobacter sp.]|jgi:hypothetical protein|nr:hypothetical protein [Candidatus Angelobacter sp.]
MRPGNFLRQRRQPWAILIPQGTSTYGLKFDPFNSPTLLMVVDLKKGTVSVVGQTVDGMHVIAKHHLF